MTRPIASLRHILGLPPPRTPQNLSTDERAPLKGQAGRRTHCISSRRGQAAPAVLEMSFKHSTLLLYICLSPTLRLMMGCGSLGVWRTVQRQTVGVAPSHSTDAPLPTSMDNQEGGATCRGLEGKSAKPCTLAPSVGCRPCSTLGVGRGLFYMPGLARPVPETSC